MRRLVLALAMLIAGASGAWAAGAAEVLPFIADDYTKAIAEARAGKRPLFVEAWAPW